MAALAGLAVALGAEPWSAALCVVAGFGAALVGALVLSLVSLVLSWALKD